jgi:hypothetical protein
MKDFDLLYTIKTAILMTAIIILAARALPLSLLRVLGVDAAPIPTMPLLNVLVSIRIAIFDSRSLLVQGYRIEKAETHFIVMKSEFREF